MKIESKKKKKKKKEIKNKKQKRIHSTKVIDIVTPTFIVITDVSFYWISKFVELLQRWREWWYKLEQGKPLALSLCGWTPKNISQVIDIHRYAKCQPD